MSPRFPEAPEPPDHDRSRAAPSEAVRERVLRVCRQELSARRAAQRRRQRLHWSLAAGVAVLLAVNRVEEQRLTSRIEALRHGPSAVAVSPRPPADVIAAWRQRVVMLAALLTDRQAL